MTINIPQQLQREDFRFILLEKNKKEPVSNLKWGETMYKFNDEKLLKHLENNNNYGIVAGFGRLRLIDIDNIEIAEKLLNTLNTFTVKTVRKRFHFYVFSNNNKNNNFKNSQGEYRADNMYVVAPGCHIDDKEKTSGKKIIGDYIIEKNIEIKELNDEELNNILFPLLKKENDILEEGVNTQLQVDKEFLEKNILNKLTPFIYNLIIDTKTKEDLKLLGFPSRSERDSKIITTLLLNGFGAYIKSIFELYPVGDKYKEHKAKEQYLEHTVKKAREYSGVRSDYITILEREITDINERVLRRKLNYFIEKISRIEDWMERTQLLNLIAFKIKIKTTILDKRLVEIKDFLLKTSPISIDELLKKPLPELDYYVYPLIPKNSLILMGGKPESFKSLLALTLILFMKSKKSFLDIFESKESPKVLYYDLENGEKIQHRRLLYLANGNNIDLDKIDKNLHFQFTFNKNNINDELKLSENYDLIILDSYRRFLEGSEDKSEITNKFFNEYLYKLREKGKSVIIIHHFRKQKTSDILSQDVIDAFRGSGDITAQLDVIYALFKSNECLSIDTHTTQFDIKVVKVKARDTYPIPNFSFKTTRDDENKKTTFSFNGYNIEDIKPKDNREAMIVKFIEDNNEVTRNDILNYIKQKTECSSTLVDKDLENLKLDGIIIQKTYGKYSVREKKITIGDQNSTEENTQTKLY